MFKKIIATILFAVATVAQANSITIMVGEYNTAVTYHDNYATIEYTGVVDTDNGVPLVNTVAGGTFSFPLEGYFGDVYASFIKKHGDPKPGNCYTLSSSGLVKLDEDPANTRIDKIEHTTCPYEQYNAGSFIKAYVTAASKDDNGDVHIKLGNLPQAKYKSTDAVGKYVATKGLPKVGSCLHILVKGEAHPYMPETLGYSDPSRVEAISCAKAQGTKPVSSATNTSTAAVAAPAAAPVAVSTLPHGIVKEAMDYTGGYMIQIPGVAAVSVDKTDKGLKAFKAQTKRYPKVGDCMEIVQIPTPDATEMDADKTSHMKLLDRSQCAN